MIDLDVPPLGSAMAFDRVTSGGNPVAENWSGFLCPFFRLMLMVISILPPGLIVHWPESIVNFTVGFLSLIHI